MALFKESEILDLESTIDEEVDVYSLTNSLDDDTTKELRFAATSFARLYIKKCKHFNANEIFVEFENSLITIQSGVFGTSFTTNGVYLYDKLPTIKKIRDSIYDAMAEENELLEKENEELKDKISRIKTELDTTKRLLDAKERELDALKRKSSGYSRSSGGSCGGGGSSSYGRC